MPHKNKIEKIVNTVDKTCLIPNEHMPKAASRAANPFVLTLDSVGGFIQVFRYRFDPHSFPETYRSLAQTSRYCQVFFANLSLIK